MHSYKLQYSQGKVRETTVNIVRKQIDDFIRIYNTPREFVRTYILKESYILIPNNAYSLHS
jgi:hypothetical protein